MKICIWFEITNNPWGGGNQFLRALGKDLIDKGHEVTKKPDRNCDVVLVNAHNRGPNLYLRPGQINQLRQIGLANYLGHFLPESFWNLFTRRGPAIVHRLDGVAELIRGRRTNADYLVPRVNGFADLTIFQSVYSKNAFEHCANLLPDKSKVIYNGVDPEVFFPLKSKKLGKTLKLVAVSWSPNITKGFNYLSQLSLLPSVELTFIGNWCPSINPEKVICVGAKKTQEVAEIMRQSDAMVHAGENESCSNAILEALACGLPVLYLDSGGNRELAGNFGAPLTGSLNDDVQRFCEQYSMLKENVLDSRSNFLIPNVSIQYLEAFKIALDGVKRSK